jgi:hypothetical protein
MAGDDRRPQARIGLSLLSARTTAPPTPSCAKRTRAERKPAPSGTRSRRVLTFSPSGTRRATPAWNPATVSLRSHRRVWWLCAACNHEWQTMAYSRSDGSGLPSLRTGAREHRRPTPTRAPLAASGRVRK